VIQTRIKTDQRNWEKKISLNIFLFLSIEWDNKIGREDVQKVYNEDDNLGLKATPKEHSPFTLEHSQGTKFNYSKLYFPLSIEG